MQTPPEPQDDFKYINSIDYKDVCDKLTKIRDIINELGGRNVVARKLRYVEVDIERERSSGKLAPDELLIPQHIIDTNIRREQSSYVQYTTSSPRAVVLQNPEKPADDCTTIEKHATTLLRFPEYQISMFATTDGMQQNGYGVMEVVQDDNMPGGVKHESVQYGDFGFAEDSRNIQSNEYVMRAYYFSKTALLEMCVPNEKNTDPFVQEQVDKVVKTAPQNSNDSETVSSTDRTLYKIYKVMFRVNKVVHVAWCCPEEADDWLRVPRPLYIGRRSAPRQEVPAQPSGLGMAPMINTPAQPVMTSDEVYETNYPYIIFPYLISENNTIQQLKGRVYLDQDTQQAATSLISSFCTSHRRASGLYFTPDGDDPNPIMQDANVYFKPGMIFKQKVKQMQLSPADSTLVSAVNMIVSANQNETSQVNFAVNNRKDSRKTATEIDAASQEQSKLTTVQVVLFSNSLRNLYSLMFDVIQSRVLAGLIAVSNTEIKQLYSIKYIIKPAGDVDVVERQQMIQAQVQMWPIVAQTPFAAEFLLDMISNMFPQYASKYIQMFKNAVEQAQQQQQMQNQGQQMAMKQIGDGIVELASKPNMFSDEGKLMALPKLEQAAAMITQMMSQGKQQGSQQPIAA